MDRILNRVFSMKTMTLGLLLFLIGIGGATFIESKYGIQAAKILVYNASWFTFLLAFLSLNLISNIFTHKMFRKEKIAILSFHLAFLVIILGAGVTRYASFEGIMVITEGESSNYIYTADPHLLVKAQNKKSGRSQVMGNKHYLSEITHRFGNHFSDEMSFENKEISVEYVNFQSKRVDSFQIDKKYKNAVVLDIVTEGMTSNYLDDKGTISVGNVPLGFEKQINANGIKIRNLNGQIEWSADFPLRSLEMSKMRESRKTGIEPDDSLFNTYEINKWNELKTTTLYQVGNSQFVVKNILYNAKKALLPSGDKNRGADYLTVKVSDGKSSKNVTLEGGMGRIPSPKMINMNGLNYQLEYGSIRKPIPFKLTCRDFQLENYPGTESPSSFASEVTLLDSVENKKINKRIFMNHVMDYKGYRFFQSSYDFSTPERKQKNDPDITILSVNHDYWGTNITYFGYLLMAIGMLLSIMPLRIPFIGNIHMPKGRFNDLNQKLKKLKSKNDNLKTIILIAIICSFGNQNIAQEPHNHEDHDHSPDQAIVQGETFHVISEKHSIHLCSDQKSNNYCC
ncbi:cytochrome c biogenesis protein ResB [bacterium]|nr:cytochrome c biogenesis protein ResB [bacterium]